MIDFKDFNENISDEMLAAYIDGNATSDETSQISAAIKSNNLLAESLDVVNDIRDYGNGFPEDYDLQSAYSLIADNPIHDFKVSEIENIIHGETTNLGSVFEDEFGFRTPNLENMTNLSIESISNPTSSAIYEAQKQFGLEPVNIEFDPNTYQWEEDTCAIRSQEIVLRSFGTFVPQENLIEQAKIHGWYHEGDGTPLDAVGNLLDLYNVPNHRMANANVFNLADELGQGHKVIVGVDVDELYGNSFWQSVKEHLVGKTPNHAMIVSGLDTSDPDNVKVILTDPGTGKTLFECPYEKFLSAWDDSNCFMVATDEPAPLQYNIDTMMNFDYESGHVASLGSIPFSDFHEHVVPNVNNYLDSIDEYIDALERTMQNGFNIDDFNEMLDKAEDAHDKAESLILNKENLKSSWNSNINEPSSEDNQVEEQENGTEDNTEVSHDVNAPEEDEDIDFHDENNL